MLAYRLVGMFPASRVVYRLASCAPREPDHSKLRDLHRLAFVEAPGTAYESKDLDYTYPVQRKCCSRGFVPMEELWDSRGK